MKLIDKKNKEKIIKIDEIPEINVNGYFDKITPKLIKAIEKTCRSSYEYSRFIDFLKNNLAVDRCTYFEGYNLANGFSLEFHHHPLTLFDIVETICYKQMEESENKEISDMMVCKEVMEVHFAFMVGLIPVNPTIHEAIHSGKIFCHPGLVLGDWKEFLLKYDKFISDRVRNKIDEMEAIADQTPVNFIPEELISTNTKIEYDRKLLSNYDFNNLIKLPKKD